MPDCLSPTIGGCCRQLVFCRGAKKPPPYRKPIGKKKKIDKKIWLNQTKKVILQLDKDSLLRTFVNKNEMRKSVAGKW